MARILITGMSGVGKSAAVLELVRRGRLAVDLDAPDWSEWVDADPADDLTPAASKDWVWRTDKVRALLGGAAAKELFVSGCAENMSELYPLIERVVLLSAPVETIMDRLAARGAEGYGGREEERRKVAELIATVEPLIRASADHEIDARAPIDAVVDELLRIAADG
ncbi:AAA family ATPase [Methylopila sp. M107]|uniref:AAA family ATPase n=1 Tax=Methylopila sp. M107 TaxID=1101190 RepID=UPI00037B580E|nr:AAA family ATPase [Methylopila sp. M107]